MKKSLNILIISTLILLFSITGCNSKETSKAEHTTRPQAQGQPASTEHVPTTEAPITTEANKELTLKITGVTSPVLPGEDATLEARTMPGAECTMFTMQPSGWRRIFL